MKRILCFLFAFILTFYPVLNIFAECRPEEEPCTFPMKSGDSAPYDGVLLNNHAVAEIKAKIEKMVELCESDITYRLGLLTTYYEARLENQLIEHLADTKEKEAQLLTKEREIEELLKITENESNNDIWWFVGGAGASALVFGGIIAIIVAVD